jgi:lipoprotein-releasing system permease protein
LQSVFAGERFIGIRLHNPDSDPHFLAMLRVIKDRFSSLSQEDFQIESWRTFNRSMFGALRVEKLVMALTVGLMFLVVAVNVFHDMRVSVREKQEDIGVLLAIGARKKDVVQIFLLQGLILGGLGSLFGAAFGVILVYNLNIIHEFFMSFANSFSGNATIGSIGRLPVELSIAESVLISASAIIAGLGAAFFATRSIKFCSSAEILRNG